MIDWIKTRSKRDLVLALVMAGGFFLLVGAVSRGLFSRASHYASSHSYEHSSGGGILFDEIFSVSPGAMLVVRVSDLDVVVSATSGSEASVVLSIDEDEDVSGDALEQMGFQVERTSEGLEISTEGDSWGHGDYDGTLHVTVPSRFDVQVRTGDGDVAVESIEGSVMLNTGDGDIALGGAMGSEVMIQTGDGDVAVGGTSSGSVRVQTGDGDVALGRLEAEDVQVRTGDGDIMIEELSGALTASTGDGDVMLHIVDFSGLEISTGDGDVTLYAPASLAADVSIRGGELILGDAFSMPATMEDRSLEGVLNGGGPQLSIRVGDGTIRLIER
ncbi:MAG: DUF4097 domain-containing protein [Gemmatimonadota bacterium]|nr:DUF4097 domain-containing protein [Gemmatimonadota bacterium]